MTDRRPGPILIDLEAEPEAAAPDPARAPAVPDTMEVPPQGAAMQQVAALAARRGSWIGRVFWSALVGLLGLIVSTALWSYVTTLITQNQVVGMVALALSAVVAIALLALIVRETAAWFRLGRLDRLHKAGEAAAEGDDLGAARAVVEQLLTFYKGREDLTWGRDRLSARKDEVFDPAALLALAETELLAPLDRRAQAEVEAAARQVATVTAIVPLALIDLVTALAANIRMIRRVADIYGGRSGALGSWRLTRSVLTHLVATGAVAMGDDMLQSIAGGGLLGRISRRFGEGVVNGALTARVGVAALEVCRPLPFRSETRPSVSALVKRALAGLFSQS